MSNDSPYSRSFSLHITIRILLCLSLFALNATLALAQAPPHTGGWVVISVDEYKSLRAKAFPAQAEAEPPPVDATLSRVEYDLRVIGELASGQARLTIDVLKEGWVRVAIPSGLFVREAHLDGKPVSLVAGPSGKASGQLSALLSHPGRSTLLLDIALPVNSNAGEESLALPATSSGVTRAVIDLPTKGVDVLLNGGLLSEKNELASGSRCIAFGRGNEPLTFAWRRKTEDHRSTQPLRMRGSLTELVGLGEDATSVSAEVNLEVTQGIARDVRLRVPDAITVNQVLGAMVADWQSKPGELQVTFLEPVEQNARFVITGEARSPRDGVISIPVLRLAEGERETGGVAVEVLGAGEIKNIKKEGLENADATDLGEMIASRQSPSLAAFRFRAGDTKVNRSLSVDVARYTPQAVLMANIEEARYDVLVTTEGKALVEAHYAVRNNQRNFLKAVLPQGATLWSAALGGTAVRPGQAPDGSVLLPLEKARSGEDAPAFSLELVYLTRETPWTDKGQFHFSLPALDLPISRTGVHLYYPPQFRVIAQPGTFRVETYSEPSSAVLEQTAPVGGPVMTSADVSELKDGVVGGVVGGVAGAVPPPAPAQPPKTDHPLKIPQSAAQALVDEYRTKSLGSKVSGILPIRVSFPAFGPAIYLVSELTTENQAPSAELTYQKEKKGGVR